MAFKEAPGGFQQNWKHSLLLLISVSLIFQHVKKYSVLLSIMYYIMIIHKVAYETWYVNN